MNSQVFARGHLIAQARITRLKPCASARWSSSTPLKPYYISTPIFYVNAVPHIGHLYSGVIADILARYSRLRHPERPVFFNTGTDEHGLKIQRAAELNGSDPREFCDRISGRFKDLAQAANLSHTRFMRTTDPDHRYAARYFWLQLEKRGAIYKGEHSGWYSVSDECFYTDAQITTMLDVRTQQPIKVSKETGQLVEWTVEENYKFRLSDYRKPLMNWLASNKTSVVPSNRREELLEQLSDPESMPDLSISRPRSRLQWGIPVPGDDSHTIYVWLEALVNYLTAVGYPWRDGKGDGKGWPTDVHIIGKDITRFHAVLFPSFLLALRMELPKTVLAHGHWTVERQKMSKSRGNVADPFEAMSKYGRDAIRYYLARIAGNFRTDSDWSERQIVNLYSRDLRGVLGNLVSRISAPRLHGTLAALDERYPLSKESTLDSYASLDTDVPEDAALKALLQALPSKVEEHFNALEIGKALDAIMDCVVETNLHISELKWWKNEENPSILRRTHFYTFEALRICAILLHPYMPEKSEEILSVIGIPPTSRGWADTTFGSTGIPDYNTYKKSHTGLFPPIESK